MDIYRLPRTRFVLYEATPGSDPTKPRLVQFVRGRRADGALVDNRGLFYTRQTAEVYANDRFIATEDVYIVEIKPDERFPQNTWMPANDKVRGASASNDT